MHTWQIVTVTIHATRHRWHHLHLSFQQTVSNRWNSQAHVNLFIKNWVIFFLSSQQITGNRTIGRGVMSIPGTNFTVNNQHDKLAIRHTMHSGRKSKFLRITFSLIRMLAGSSLTLKGNLARSVFLFFFEWESWGCALRRLRRVETRLAEWEVINGRVPEIA